MTRWTAADLARANANIADGIASPLRSKFRAEPTHKDGIRFASKLEARHYEILKLLKAAGEIRYFLRQVVFHLPGEVRHIVDWMVVVDSPPIFLDSKGSDLPMGRLKRKQVRELYGVEIHLWTESEVPECLRIGSAHRIGCCCITCRNKVM